jgi:glycosyltransferase involved in cell wall biosynthesis
MSTEKPIRVGIDGRVLMHYEMRGFARYTVELFRAMKEVAGGSVELCSLSSGPIAPEFIRQLEITPIVFPVHREMLWEQVDLPKQLERHSIDIFHSTANRGLPYRRACKYVLTCHDVIDRLPEYSGREPWRGRWRKAYSDFVSRHSADAYITVSNFSKQDICRLHTLRPDRVTVIYNAAHPRFYEILPKEKVAQVLNKYSLPRNYILFLGGFDLRKNANTLVDAFAKLPPDAPPLVLAGEHKWGFVAIAKKIKTLSLTQRIACPGAIDDDDLPALYQGAIALVNPSLYEGFGLQLVEAMASGLPVLASETTSLPEVLDGAGQLFDPEDPASVASAMERICRDPTLRSTLVEKSRERAKCFSWQKAASQTLSLYRQLLGRTNHLADIDPLAASECRP